MEKIASEVKTGNEIERKFILSGFPEDLEIIETLNIRQFYLNTDKERVTRLRTVSSSNGIEGFITVKGKNVGIERPEEETPINVDFIYNCERFAIGDVIEKTRTTFMHDGRKWELDVFHGKLQGLVILEVELESVDALVNPPSFALLDISDEHAFANSRMALDPASAVERYMEILQNLAMKRGSKP